MNRRDRILLEEMDSRYGTDVLANAIMIIANNQNKSEEPSLTTSEEMVLEFIKFLEGARIRLREIHWETENHTTHELTDKMIESLENCEDNIAEDFMGLINYRIKVGTVVPRMPESTELTDLISEAIEMTKVLSCAISDDERYAGLLSELDELIHYLNKAKYLSTMQ